MKINVLLSPTNVDELFFSGKTTIVIDVLRATSTIITALYNGAREVIPVNTIEFAMKVSGNAFGGATILGGERNTKKIEGFTLGNSPLEYTREAVQGKSVILFTTNGTKAFVKAKFSANLIPACFNNLNAVVNHILELNTDVYILCAGSNGMFCIEDTICAGKIVRELIKFKPEIELSDSAKASLALDTAFGEDLIKLFTECEHGKLLVENGFEKDLEYIAQIGSLDFVPKYESGLLKCIPKNEIEKDKPE